MLANHFLPGQVAEPLQEIATTGLAMEQYMDFLRNRTFRQSLLVRQGLSVNRALTPDRLMPLWVSAALRPVKPAPNLPAEVEEEFRAPNGGMLRTPNPVTKAAMVVLARQWPGALAFGDLLREALGLLNQQGHQPAPAGLSAADTLASDLLQCYAAGLLELHACPSNFVIEPGARPKASPLARWQAARGLSQVTTFRHELTSIDANLGRLLQVFDGTRDRETIYRLVTDWTLAGATATGKSRKQLAGPVRERVDQALVQVARSALLLA
jgi:methyltransferase-like protein